jgi:hypothetical protein
MVGQAEKHLALKGKLLTLSSRTVTRTDATAVAEGESDRFRTAVFRWLLACCQRLRRNPAAVRYWHYDG